MAAGLGGSYGEDTGNHENRRVGRLDVQEHRRLVSQMTHVPLTDSQRAVADSIFKQKLEENRQTP